MTDETVPGGCNMHPPEVRLAAMSKVLQIRGVPDDVHAALVAAAEAEKLSLTRFALRELTRVARRHRVAEENAAVIADTRARVRGRVSRHEILAALQEGRDV